MATRVHIKAILDEYMRIIESSLKTSLGLSQISIGTLDFMPTRGVNTMAPFVLVAPSGASTFQPVELPTPLMATYEIRMVYVRKIKQGEDAVAIRLDEAQTFAEVLWDNFDMANLDITNGNILWGLPFSIEWEPPEDAFVATIAADLMATAFNVEVKVRTRR